MAAAPAAAPLQPLPPLAADAPSALPLQSLLRALATAGLLLFFFPWDAVLSSGLQGKSTGHLHDRLVLGSVAVRPLQPPPQQQSPPPQQQQQQPAALASSAALPSGGGGEAGELEWWPACQAALAGGGAPGVGPLPGPHALPPAMLPIKDVMRKADYTRNAVAAAWAECTRSVPALASPRPHFTVLETSEDLELTTWAGYADLPHIDRCHYDGTGACDIHTLSVARPLSEAQRSDAAAVTGHAKLTRAPYDLQMYSQTLEHLYDLPLAAARMYSLAAPGGCVWISLPFWNVPHMRPNHQQGASPCGLYGLLRGAGFEVLRLGWYGHANYSDFLARPGSHWPNAKELRLPDPFDTIPVPNPDAANTVWVLAQRPTAEAAAAAAQSQAQPQLQPLDIALRPMLTFDEMFRCLDPDDGQLLHSRPSPSTLLHLLNRFPAWLDADLANVVLAAAFHERLLPHAAGEVPLAIGGRTARAVAGLLLPPRLVRSWSASALQELLAQHRQQGQQQQQPQDLPAAGFLSDLFEGFRDPLDTLRAFALTVRPGAPLLLSCRPGDSAFASRPTLGTCTADGFLQLLCRAGLTPAVASYGAWGRIAYTRAALVEGHYTTFRTYLPRVAENVLVLGAAGEAAPAPAMAAFAAQLKGAASLGAVVDAGGASTEGLLEALAEHIVADFAGEAAFSWPAVVYALVEGWSLPLVPHYALNDTAWHKP